MEIAYNPNYPTVEDLRKKAKKRIPGFAFDYLDGGCNSEINLRRNTAEIREVQLKTYYLRNFSGASMEATLFGKTYSAPFGVAPVGLQGMIWPESAEILAEAAYNHNLPFILSTVSTASIEKISKITEGNAWFQLYHPAEDILRDDLLKRAEESGLETLVILSDVPSFGFRPKEIKNGLAMPPRITLKNIWQIMCSPSWALATLAAGQPEFKTLKPYIPRGMNLRHLGLFMNKTFNGRLSDDRVKTLRDKWKGNLVLKGVASEEDAQKAIDFGLDGIIVSNHGGRQLDCGESTIKPLKRISDKFKDQISIMMDSGLREGPDIANALAMGADFTFLGRSFMYGVSALGKKGGNHTISILKTQLKQVMEQVCCENPAELKKRVV